MCGKKKSRRDRGDMWWWNAKVKNTTARKATFDELCRFCLKEIKTQHKRLRNQTRKFVARTMRMKIQQELNNLRQNDNSVVYFQRRMKKERS